MPLPDSEHAAIASRLAAWLTAAGWPADQVLQTVGIETPGSEEPGGRTPDLTVWSGPQRRSDWLPVSELLVVAEIVSPASAVIDKG